jgi:predicted nucleic acid-binding protein
MELEPLKTDRQLKIYLDVCCLNRPFDDWTQERVRFEGESILNIVERMRAGQWQLVSSEAIAVELAKLRNLEKKENILKLLQLARVTIEIDEEIDLRSCQLEALGFGLYDSFHLACAEAASVDIFLSTDDRLIKNAKRNQNILKVEVSNPVIWFMNFLQA